MTDTHVKRQMINTSKHLIQSFCVSTQAPKHLVSYKDHLSLWLPTWCTFHLDDESPVSSPSKSWTVALNASHHTVLQCRREGLLRERQLYFHARHHLRKHSTGDHRQCPACSPNATKHTNIISLKGFLTLLSKTNLLLCNRIYQNRFLLLPYYSSWKPIGNYHRWASFCLLSLRTETRAIIRVLYLQCGFVFLECSAI